MGLRSTESGIRYFEGLNERRARMRAWKNKADHMAKRLEKELRKLDPGIEVDFIEPEAANNHPRHKAPGAIPGRWHIIVPGRDGIDHYFPITGENRAYRDPEMAVVDEMKARDLWRRGALRQIREDEEKEAERLRRQQITESEQRVDQVAEAYRAAKRVPGDGGETRNFAKKRKGEKGGVILPAGVET